MRVTIGAMLVWVFFENLGKGLYRPAGYAGLIHYYIEKGHSPAAWKAIMGLVASHAALAAPGQAVTEISLGILLVIGLLTRPVAFIAFLYLGTLWMSEWGTAWRTSGPYGAIAVYLCEPESDDGAVENGFIAAPALGDEFPIYRCYA